MSLSELWSLYGQNYIDALLATWGMTLESFAIAMVLAVAVTVMRVSPLKPLRVFGDLYVQVFRNIPGIALLIIVVYALPHLRYRRYGPFGLGLWFRELHERHQHRWRRPGGSRPLARYELQPYPRQDRDSAGAALERITHDQPLYRRHAYHRARQSGTA